MSTGSPTAIVRASANADHRASSRFFTPTGTQNADQKFQPLRLQEYCKRSVLRQVGLGRADIIDKFIYPRVLKLYLKKLLPEYFMKPENFGWLHYLNHFNLRNVHVAECIIDRTIYTIKMVSSTFSLPSATINSWKAIRHPNIMQFVGTVREAPPWRVYDIFQGTSMSLRVCDELKACRKLVIPEKLLWDVIEQVVEGLLYIYHEQKLVYNNFSLDHVYYGLDGMKVILENPLLHDFPTLSTQPPVARDRSQFRSAPRLIISEENGTLHDTSTDMFPDYYLLKESERRAVQCLGRIMERLSLPADSSSAFFGSGNRARREQTVAAQRAVRSVHYSERFISLVESLCGVGVETSLPSLIEILEIVREARKVLQMAVSERYLMTIMEYVRPDEGPVPIIRRYLSPWNEIEETETLV